MSLDDVPNSPKLTLDPSDQGDIQEVLRKVVASHQQALSLLQQTEMAYGRLVPHQLLKLLEVKSIVDVKLGDQVERKMTILFSDIRDFTTLSESMTPAENFEFINSYLSQMEPVISKYRGIIDKYIGDAIMALFAQGADDAVNGAVRAGSIAFTMRGVMLSRLKLALV
jgi:hemerythrin